MALPTITSFTANTTIASAEMNTNLTNLKERSDIAPTAGHITLTPGTSKLVRIAVLRQDNTTNTYTNNSIILTGWGWKLGDGTSNMSEAITFGITFDAAPIVVPGALGFINSDPDSIDDFNSSAAFVSTNAYSIATTGFTVGISRAPQGSDAAVRVLDNTNRWGYSWIAIGTLA